MASKDEENPEKSSKTRGFINKTGEKDAENAIEIVNEAEKLHNTTPKGLETRGERVCRFIESYCRAPDGMYVGQPIRLDPFQRKFILDVYDNPHGTELAILSIARKNAKTALIACLVIVHLVGPEAKLNSEINSGAMSRDQAAKVFTYAKKMIEMSPRLKGIITIVPSQKMLKGRPMKTTYQAISADAKTAMGGSPLVLILDELGQIRGPQDDFVDAMLTSQGAHDAPIAFVISTQAQNDTDLLSIMIDDARKSKDPKIICHVYEAKNPPKGKIDVMDEAGWYAANPALGTFRSLDDMIKMAKRAKRMPSFEGSFRNLYLNQRAAAGATAMELEVWELNSGEPVPIEECMSLYGAIDLSARNDLTAFVLIGWAQGKWNVYVWCWTPEQRLKERADRDKQPYQIWAENGLLLTTPGAKVSYAYVAQQIADIIKDLEVQVIVYDRWKIDDFKDELEKIAVELPLEEWGQGFKDMEFAVDTAEEYFMEGNMRHGGHPVLTMCAVNARVVKDPAGNRKLDKKKSTGRIDAYQALVMASGASKRFATDSGDFDDFINDPLSA